MCLHQCRNPSRAPGLGMGLVALASYSHSLSSISGKGRCPVREPRPGNSAGEVGNEINVASGAERWDPLVEKLLTFLFRGEEIALQEGVTGTQELTGGLSTTHIGQNPSLGWIKLLPQPISTHATAFEDSIQSLPKALSPLITLALGKAGR